MTVAEGIRVVEEALAAGVEMHGSIISQTLERTPRGAALVADLTAHAVPLEEVPEDEFAELADTEHPQGVLALVSHRVSELAAIAPRPRAPVLILDGVQDPGNVGTLLRTGFALGAAGVVLVKGSADVTNPKVVRSAMGASFRLPIARAQESDLAPWVSRHGIALWAAVTEGTPLARLDVPERLGIIIGNEGAGVSAALASLAVERVVVPLARGAESLNVAVAAGIILHEVTRA